MGAFRALTRACSPTSEHAAAREYCGRGTYVSVTAPKLLPFTGLEQSKSRPQPWQSGLSCGWQPPRCCMLSAVASPPNSSGSGSAKPVAIRIQRPYDSESELLAAEGPTLTRSTLLLLGAKNRPPGTILRFELVLRTGTPMLRGEGKVLEYQEESSFGMAGLVVKFSRLDARSKKFLEDTFGPPSTVAPQSIPPMSMPPSSLAPESHAPPSLPGDGPEASHATPPHDSPHASRPSERPNRFSEPVTATYSTLDDGVPSAKGTSAGNPSALDRLRARGKALSDEQRAAILGPRKSV